MHYTDRHAHPHRLQSVTEWMSLSNAEGLQEADLVRLNLNPSRVVCCSVLLGVEMYGICLGISAACILWTVLKSSSGAPSDGTIWSCKAAMMHMHACQCADWPHKLDNICMAARCVRGLHQDEQKARQLQHDLNHRFQHAKACS